MRQNSVPPFQNILSIVCSSMNTFKEIKLSNGVFATCEFFLLASLILFRQDSNDSRHIIIELIFKYPSEIRMKSVWNLYEMDFRQAWPGFCKLWNICFFYLILIFGGFNIFLEWIFFLIMERKHWVHTLIRVFSGSGLLLE